MWTAPHGKHDGDLAFSPDGKSIFIGDGNEIKVCDALTGTVDKSFTIDDIVSQLAVTPDGKRVISGSEDNTLRLWDLGSGQELRTLAEGELAELPARREQVLEALKEKLVTDSEASIRSIILEVRAGTGGEEAALFASELLNMYLAYAKRHGFGSEPYMVRRRWDYFVRHLLGAEPPKEYPMKPAGPRGR